MKPKDLKHPFPWTERHVLIQDRVWFVPDLLIEPQCFEFPGWEHSDLFGNSNPVCVEYCSGNGSWIAEKARQNPQINWVAVEIRFDRVRKIWSKLKNRVLSNLIVICGEGGYATSHFFPDRSVKEIFINFPDPWPKTRHAKHRIVKPKFIHELRRVLAERGQLTMVTDDEDYSIEMIKTVTSVPEFQSVHPLPFYVTHLEGYGESYFEQLWRDKGKTIRYHQFGKL